MSLIKLTLKNKPKLLKKKNELLQLVIADIQSISNYETELKFDSEITERVCKHVENFLCSKTYKKLDKKEIAIDILKQLFQYDDAELEIIKKDVEYLYNLPNVPRCLSIDLQ